MNLGDLTTATFAEVAALPVSVHAALVEEFAALQDRTRRIGAVLDAGLQQAYGGQNAPGTSHRERDGFDIKTTIPKSVAWDSDTLETMATDPQVAEYVDCKLSVSEGRYKAMPQRIRDVVDRARTVKMGKVKFEFVKKEG